MPRHADVRNYKFSNVQCFITRNSHGSRTVSRHLCNVYFNDRIVHAIEISYHFDRCTVFHLAGSSVLTNFACFHRCPNNLINVLIKTQIYEKYSTIKGKKKEGM